MKRIRFQEDFNRLLLPSLRSVIFVAFGLLSFRLIFIAVTQAPSHPLPVALILTGAGALSWIATSWSLFGLFIAFPLFNGLCLLGLIPPFPFLSDGFAVIYLVWFLKRILFERKGFSPMTQVGSLVDLLSGIVILSLFVSYLPYPKDLVFFHFWRGPLQGQDGLFYCTQAATILLGGLFTYRLLELEVTDRRTWAKLIPVLYLHTTVILFFSIFQLIFHKPAPLYGFAIYAPFEDIHSYGSDLSLLLFPFLGLGWGGVLKQKILGGIYGGIIFLFVVLSYSRAAWLAVIVVLTFLAIWKLSKTKRVLLITAILSVLLFVNLYPEILLKSNEAYLQRLGNLLVVKEMKDISVDVRLVMWKRALNIIEDFPLTGSGAGSFYAISPLYQDLSAKELRDFYENAHNYFLQFASDLGLPALILFLAILFFTYRAGFRPLSRDGPRVSTKGFLLGLSAYLITCLTGHPLLLSTQQFLFWFIVSLIVAPSSSITHKEPNEPICRKISPVFVLLMMMVVSAHLYSLWGVRGKQQYVYPYPYEIWDGKKVRWTAERSFSRAVAAGGLISLDVHAFPHNIGPGGLNFRLFLNKKLWDELNFTKSEAKNLKYFIPYKNKERVEIETRVSRTFIPIRIGLNNDPRELGVAIGEVRFHPDVPEEGVGFLGEETLRGGKIEGRPEEMSLKFRWTGMRASMKIEDKLRNGVTLFLVSAHPDVGKNPVTVEISGDAEKIGEIVFTHKQWEKVHLDQKMLKDKKVLTFHVSRTWNPKLLGLSEDRRDLGVAVALQTAHE